ncbi:MAG: type II toxin-antitoxin system VapC family toxin [Pyrinomonadaceae bacterium]
MIVVDTNVIIYLILSSDLTEIAIEVRRKDKHWAAPMLWRSEFRNVLLGYFRRDLMSLFDVISISELAESKVESRHVDGSRVIELAAESGCTAYDCEFISLAERLSIPLVTSDKKLLAAFPTIAVSMEAFTA